jgi:hypothetical protein
MKLTQLAAKPQLVKIELNDEEITKEYGEPLEFWIYDRQPIDQFIRLAQMKDENMIELVEVIKKMVLDENGIQVLNDESLLPTKVLTKVVGKVVETLGK